MSIHVYPFGLDISSTIVAVVVIMANINMISRRNFFDSVFSASTNLKLKSTSFLNPLKAYNSNVLKSLPPIENEVLLLNRTSFGIKPADYARIKTIGVENYLEQQLDYQSIDNSELEDILDQVYPMVDFSLTQIVEYIEEGNDLGEDRIADAAIQLISETMIRQLYSKQQLFEVMVEFWTNHFNVDIAKGLDLIFKIHEDKHIIRPNSLGNFRELLHADSKSVAMLYYLDNFTNTKSGPNENYAREIMELHTLGVNGGYTEDDVKEVARCFTGWSLGANGGDFFEFYDFDHDDGIKNVLGHVIDNQEGILDGEQVVDILADSSATAGFIATKMVRRFCSDFPDSQLVKTVAKTYLSSDGDIQEMLRTIFHSRQFLDSVDSKFKRPIEFVSSLFRSIDSESNQINTEQMFYPLGVLFQEYETSGQLPFFWSPPTGYPDIASYWTSVSSLLKRINLANGIAHGDIEYPFDGNYDYGDVIGYRFDELFEENMAPLEIINILETEILYRQLTQEDSLLVEEFLLLDGEDVSVLRIRAALGIVLSSTYFQLR